MPDSPKPTSNSRTIPAVTPLHPRQRGIIIGASSGIGAALARRLAHEGYTLALLARRNDLLRSLCNEINQSHGETRTLSYVHDVTDCEFVPELLRKIVADLGGLDLVVYVDAVEQRFGHTCFPPPIPDTPTPGGAS